MTIEKLNQLITVGANQHLEHPLDYVRLFLSKTAQIMKSQVPFVYMNMQYIQCYPQNHGNRFKRLEGIPTHINADVDENEISKIMLNVVSFLKSLQVIDTLRPDDLGIPLKIMGQPFTIELINTNSNNENRFIKFDRHFKILTINVPLIYDLEFSNKHFNHLKEPLRELIAKAMKENMMIDGAAFETLVFLDPVRNAFAEAISKFLKDPKILNLYDQLEKDFYAVASDSRFDVSENDVAPFIKTILLHAFLKDISYSYQIPVTHVFTDQEKKYQGSLLIASRKRLSVQQLSVFQIAFNIAMNHLKDFDLSADSIHTLPGKSARIVRKRKLQSGLDGFMGMIGKSTSMLNVFEKIEKVSLFDVDVLILGESGTGKDKVAKAIHHLSNRNKNPYIAISLADRPDSLIDSELFGHEKGTFTGAIDQRKGYFERAHSGTLFLDEITYIPQNVQAKLLRVLQNREFERLGGNTTVGVDVRIITATSERIDDQATRDKLRFLDPLYYRMERYIIKLPALRERKEDIPYLVQYYLSKLDPEGTLCISEESLDMLMAYHWPGNVRQLFGLLDRAFINAYGENEIEPKHFDCPELDSDSPRFSKLCLSHEHIEVLRVFRENRLNIERTTRFINKNSFSVSRKTLIRYVKEICLITLANNGWDLEKAIAELAGEKSLTKKAAQKYRDYFYAPKNGESIFDTAIADNPAPDLKHYVRQSYEEYFLEFVNRIKQKDITAEYWKFVVSRYL